jgi:hypothetical protein
MGGVDEEYIYDVRVFSRGDYGLSGAEYETATPPAPGDEIDVRWLHGNPTAYGRTPRGKVRVVSVDHERRMIEAHELE